MLYNLSYPWRYFYIWKRCVSLCTFQMQKQLMLSLFSRFSYCPLIHSVLFHVHCNHFFLVNPVIWIILHLSGIIFRRDCERFALFFTYWNLFSRRKNLLKKYNYMMDSTINCYWERIISRDIFSPKLWARIIPEFWNINDPAIMNVQHPSPLSVHSC